MGGVHTSAVPQDSLCSRRFLPSPRPSPCKGEGGERVSPNLSLAERESHRTSPLRRESLTEPLPCRERGSHRPSPLQRESHRTSPLQGEGAINAQELLWL